MPLTITSDKLPACDSPEKKINPSAAARFVLALMECGREMQEIALEMAAIVVDEKSTDDERAVAFDAMMEALFPGTSTDILELYHRQLKSPEAVEAAAELKAEEGGFADRVRKLMVEKNITQEQIAREIGIGQSAVSNILSRQCRPQRRTIVRFAEALNVKPEELWPNINSDED